MRVFLPIIAASVLAAAQPVFVGNWLGSLDTGAAKLRVVFHVSAGPDGLIATFDSLDQNLVGASVRDLRVTGDTVRFGMPDLGASYEGTIAEDGLRLIGRFSQKGSVPVELRKVDRVELLPRPQQPRAPFPYTSLEIGYSSRGSQLVGTLTVPSGPGPFPAVMLISGIGPQDRDATMAAHKPFWVVADYLTRRGIAVLRVDDRGVGKSEGAAAGQTLDDIAVDVLSGLEFLKRQTAIDPERLGLIGHSEGGMVAPLAAVRSGDVKFLVTLAGLGVPGDEMLAAQAETLARAAGAKEDTITQNRAIQKVVFDVLRTEVDNRAASNRLTVAFQNMKSDLPAAQRTLFESPGLEAAMQRRYAAVSAPDIRSVVLANPAEVFRQVKVPVLALNGAKDAQVPASLNLPAVAAALAAGGNTNFTVAVLPGLNHQFQTCGTCQPAEYGELEETFAPAALQILGDWIVRQTVTR